MSEEVSKTDLIWNRLTELEQHRAATTTDIRGIYAGLDEIRDVLVRMQENAKPNIGGMFLILLATCTFFVTVGGLSLAPVYRDLTRLYDAQASMEIDQTENHRDRFTYADGRNLEDKLEIRHHTYDELIATNRDRIATIEGYLKGKDR